MQSERIDCLYRAGVAARWRGGCPDCHGESNVGECSRCDDMRAFEAAALSWAKAEDEVKHLREENKVLRFLLKQTLPEIKPERRNVELVKRIKRAVGMAS